MDKSVSFLECEVLKTIKRYKEILLKYLMEEDDKGINFINLLIEEKESKYLGLSEEAKLNMLKNGDTLIDYISERYTKEILSKEFSYSDLLLEIKEYEELYDKVSSLDTYFFDSKMKEYNEERTKLKNILKETKESISKDISKGDLKLLISALEYSKAKSNGNIQKLISLKELNHNVIKYYITNKKYIRINNRRRDLKKGYKRFSDRRESTYIV